MTEAGPEVHEGDLEAIWGPVWEGLFEGRFWSILGSILDHIWTLSRKPHKYLKLAFIWP